MSLFHLAASVTVSATASNHPNKMPFSGVLTHVDQPSASAPHGSNGKRVTLSRLAAESALPTLIGMGVNLAPDLSGHKTDSVVGVIDAASINGDAVEIGGYVFARNFPVQAATIKTDHKKLGFSYEMDVREVESLAGDPLVITDCIFTGAAILLRNKGAYLNTSLAAAATEGTDMTNEEVQAAIKAAVDGAVKPLQDKITAMEQNPLQVQAANLLAKVEPHAARLEASAEKMEKDGIGAGEPGGHATHLRKMASDMRASAARGEMPSRYYSGMMASSESGDKAITDAVAKAIAPLADKLSAQDTIIADLKASAAATREGPQRRTVPGGANPNEGNHDNKVPSVALSILASKGLSVTFDELGAVSSGKLSAAMESAGIPMRQQTIVKTSLIQAGIDLAA